MGEFKLVSQYQPKGDQPQAIEALADGKTVAEIAQKHDVHPNQVTEWRRQLMERAAGVFGGAVAPEAPPVDLKALHAKIEHYRDLETPLRYAPEPRKENFDAEMGAYLLRHLADHRLSRLLRRFGGNRHDRESVVLHRARRLPDFPRARLHGRQRGRLTEDAKEAGGILPPAFACHSLSAAALMSS